MSIWLSDCHGDLTEISFYSFRFVAVAFAIFCGLISNGKTMDAEELSEQALSNVGLRVGINENPNVFAVIGVFQADIDANTDCLAFEKLRQKGVRTALLDAKGKLALAIHGRSETTKEMSISGSLETFRIVCKAFANMRTARCTELQCSESWSKEHNVYKIAIPIIYRKDKNPNNIVSAPEYLDDKDSMLLSTKVNSLDASQRIGCFKWRATKGRECIVAFGSVNIEGKTGRDLHKSIKTAELMALGNMAFWLNSDINVRVVAEECLRSDKDKSYNWERFNEIVLAQCEHKHFPCNEVSSGRCISPITKKLMYWCAFGARLTRINSK